MRTGSRSRHPDTTAGLRVASAFAWKRLSVLPQSSIALAYLLARQRSFPRQQREENRISPLPIQMPQVRSLDPFALEADLRCHALGRHVGAVGNQLKPLEMQFVERVAADSPEGPRGDAPTPGLGSTPIADVAGLVFGRPQPDRPNDRPVLADGELVPAEAERS